MKYIGLLDMPTFFVGGPLEIVDRKRTGDVAQILREQDNQHDGSSVQTNKCFCNQVRKVILTQLLIKCNAST